jgi:hypothetical protein
VLHLKQIPLVWFNINPFPSCGAPSTHPSPPPQHPKSSYLHLPHILPLQSWNLTSAIPATQHPHLFDPYLIHSFIPLSSAPVVSLHPLLFLPLQPYEYISIPCFIAHYPSPPHPPFPANMVCRTGWGDPLMEQIENLRAASLPFRQWEKGSKSRFSLNLFRIRSERHKLARYRCKFNFLKGTEATTHLSCGLSQSFRKGKNYSSSRAFFENDFRKVFDFAKSSNFHHIRTYFWKNKKIKFLCEGQLNFAMLMGVLY